MQPWSIKQRWGITMISEFASSSQDGIEPSSMVGQVAETFQTNRDIDVVSFSQACQAKDLVIDPGKSDIGKKCRNYKSGKLFQDLSATWFYRWKTDCFRSWCSLF
jgi:hypothetical protein